MISRVRMILIGAAAFALAACGSDSGGAGSTSSASITSVAPSAAPSTAPSTSPASSTASTSSSASSSTTAGESVAAPSPSSTDDPGGEKAKDDGNIKTVDGEKVVPGTAVAESVSQELGKIIGRRPDKVECPDLPAKVDTKIRCTLTDSGDVYGVTITTTSVVKNNVEFDIRVDEQPQ